MNWAAGLRATMSTEEKVRDAASAQILKAEREIEAREDSFSSVLDLGEAMVQTGHYAAMVSLSQKVYHNNNVLHEHLLIISISILRRSRKSVISCWMSGRGCILLGSKRRCI